MKRLFTYIVVVLALAGLATTGCSQPASTPPPPPTAAPAKAAEPAKAPAPATAAPTAQPAATKAPQPTAAPAKARFPEKGRPITIIVPYAAGGGNDIPARSLAPLLEKELGTPVQVVNRAGAASQIGLTELVLAKPDGYTLGYTPQPAGMLVYLDPERKAVFSRKDFLPLALDNVDTGAIVVTADSPYKTAKDLIDAAKAKPGGLKSGTEGLMGTDHLGTMQFEKLTGTKFTLVHFDGAAPANTALLGGHVDVRFSKLGSTSTLLKGRQARAIAIMDKDESKLYPGVKTLEAQGYKLYWSPVRGISLPAGTPKDVVDVLSAALKKCVEEPERKQKLSELGFEARYLGPEQFAALWDEIEVTTKPLLEEAKRAAAGGTK